MKNFFLLLLFPLFVFSQELDNGETYENYTLDYNSREYESDNFNCRIAPYNVAYDGVDYCDKTDFNELNDLIFWYNLAFTRVSKKYSWKNEFRFAYTKVEFEFVYGDESRTIAQAHSPLKDDVRIIIDIDKWEKLNCIERRWLFFHEYAHEAYGLNHGEIKLMYPLLPSDKLAEHFDIDKKDYLDERTFNKVFKSRINTQDTYLVPALPEVCDKPDTSYYVTMSKANAYLFNAMMEFMYYISLEGSNKAKNIYLSVEDNSDSFPKLKSNGKSAFPDNKITWAYKFGYWGE